MKFFMKFLLIGAFLSAVGFITQCKKSGGDYLQLHEKEYLTSSEWEVLAFHNDYPVGKQGGIEFIIRDRRLFTNGGIVVERKSVSDGSGIVYDPIPDIEKPLRQVNHETGVITLLFEYPDINLNYSIELIPKGDELQVKSHILSDFDAEEVEAIWFQIELFPDDFFEKSFISESGFGNFPYRFTGSDDQPGVQPQFASLAKGKSLNIAPECNALNMYVKSNVNDLELIDDRKEAQRGWFILRTQLDLSAKEKSAEITFSPKIMGNWLREPVIAHSQVGYHTGHPKVAFIETDQRDKKVSKVKLHRIEPDGSQVLVKNVKPNVWGQWLRYRYLTFDFSDVVQPGMYQIVYGNTETSIFPISDQVFKYGVWQPTLETFIPVQMCHMRVEDRGQIWHGACHLDDGLQAPSPLHHFDGFRQKESTETKFKPLERIPGLSQGGWHDAADDDINTGSTGRTTYHLALVADEFNVMTDRTSINFESREVQLHRPDGKPDVLQQVLQGVKWLLAPYRVGNHSFVGVISSDWDTYIKKGDWAQYTDNLFYNPDLPLGTRTATHSGVPDDRYVFTNKDTRTEYMVASILAASARVLSDFAPEKSEECLRVSREIWEREKDLAPVFFSSVGTPENLTGQKANAAVELYLTTRDNYYLDELVNMKDSILSNFSQSAWTVSRIIDKINDSKFVTAYENQLKVYAREIEQDLNSNPFGIYFTNQIWGLGWNNLWNTVEHFFLVKNYPDLFPASQVHNPLFFNLGVHYGSNHSFVSAVGSNSMIPTFGINLPHYSVIPGGSYSGTGLLFPDFPELKSNHPYLWQQSEYIIPGGSAFVFCALASEYLAERE